MTRVLPRTLLVLLLLTACSAAPVEGPSPPTLAGQEANLSTAAQVAAGRGQLVIRFNPVRCSCPPFEIQLGARWVRVRLEQMDAEGSPASLLAARAKIDLNDGKLSHYPVRGDLSTSPEICAQGTFYLTLSIESDG